MDDAGLLPARFCMGVSSCGRGGRSSGLRRQINFTQESGENPMAVERWDPFREAVSLRDAMNALFQESFLRPSSVPGHAGSVPLPLDVSENQNEFVVKASMPGIRPEDVQITVLGDALTIQGETKDEQERKGERWHVRERRFGAFHRSITLPTAVDSDKAQAQFEHGVLTLTLPKSETAKPRQIKINGAKK
jgi:HSP20 family protein